MLSKFDQPQLSKLLKYQNRHIGQAAYLIGNGPSVRIEDLERLSSTVTFCCNRFHLAYHRFAFRPTYTCCCDKQMREDFGQEIIDQTAGDIFIASEKKPEFFGEYNWLFLEHFKPVDLFKRPIQEVVTTGGSVMIFAIQLGFFMGINRFYLYGVDHTANFKIDKKATDPMRAAIGEGNHFIENYRSGKPWCPQNVPQVEESFRVCDRFMRSRGGYVKNATRGGKLELLERVDFDEALKSY